MGVFVQTDTHKLVPMKTAQFATEREFQSLLVEFPELLSGDTAERDTPQRWLLLNREQSVPAGEGGAGRWAIDHLFVDQDGVPTLVEVKRQTDTRLRREVVGQMLDYAANAVVYLPVEQLRADFKSTHENPEETIRDHSEIDPEEFWQKLKTNLQAGRIRLLFVADQIPDELKRIVEFLNAQMDPAEVLALELQRFEGEGLKTIVPVVYGRTEVARRIKGSGRSARQWDRESFFAALRERNDPKAIQVAESLATWMEGNADRIEFGAGATDGSMTMVVGDGFPCRMWVFGKFVINFQYLSGTAPFKEETKRVELLNRLNKVGGINLTADRITKRSRITMGELYEGTRLKDFLAVMNWVVSKLRSDVAPHPSSPPGSGS